LFACKDQVNTNVVIGNTLSVNCFYEGQGRLDGAICQYSLQDKMQFLEKLANKGVCNIEMEALQFAAFTEYMQIPAAVVCCTLVDRSLGDQVTMTAQNYADWVNNVVTLIVSYIQKSLSKPKL
jgi:uridine phosphorylase